MTVADFKAYLENAAVDAFGDIVFVDNAGHTLTPATIEVVPHPTTLPPSGGSDPANKLVVTFTG